MIVSRDVVFMEDMMPYLKQKSGNESEVTRAEDRGHFEMEGEQLQNGSETVRCFSLLYI